MKPASNNESDDSRWQPCEPGSLSAYAASDRQRRRARVLTWAGGVSVILLIGSLSYVATRPIPAIGPIPIQGEPYGGISCAIVYANKAAYLSGSLNPELKEKMRIHLRDCPHCRGTISNVEQQTLRSYAIKRYQRFMAISSTFSTKLD